jgi:hypothetical protein
MIHKEKPTKEAFTLLPTEHASIVFWNFLLVDFKKIEGAST